MFKEREFMSILVNWICYECYQPESISELAPEILIFFVKCWKHAHHDKLEQDIHSLSAILPFPLTPTIHQWFGEFFPNSSKNLVSRTCDFFKLWMLANMLHQCIFLRCNNIAPKF